MSSTTKANSSTDQATLIQLKQKQATARKSGNNDEYAFVQSAGLDLIIGSGMHLAGRLHLGAKPMWKTPTEGNPLNYTIVVPTPQANMQLKYLYTKADSTGSSILLGNGGSFRSAVSKTNVELPKANSQTSKDAEEWLAGQELEMKAMLKEIEKLNPSISTEALAVAAMSIRNSFVSVARQSIADPRVFAKLEMDGDALNKKLMEDAFKRDKLKLEVKHNACFVAGTLVHTDKGLVPIEQLKVGDMVLSKHESNTGEQAYKRVLSTFKSATRQPIMGIKFLSQTLENLADELRNTRLSQKRSVPNDDGKYFDQAKYDLVAKKVTEFFEQRYQCSFDQEEVANQYRGTYEMHLFCTDNHPFWVEGQGWTAANQLYRFDKLQSYDGDQLRIDLFDAKAYGPLYKTSIAGIAAYTRLDEDDAERFREIMDINFIDFRFGKPTFVWPSMSYNKELFLSHKEDYKAGNQNFYTSKNHPLENYYLRFDAPNYPAQLPVGQQLVDYPNEDLDPMRFSTEYDEIETHISLSHRDASNKSLSLKFEDYVYNIEVEDYHTYFVGEAGVWVHNTNCIPADERAKKTDHRERAKHMPVWHKPCKSILATVHQIDCAITVTKININKIRGLAQHVK